MSKFEDEKLVALIGNNVAGDLLTLLLPENYKVIKISSKETSSQYMPYYPNDITNGIMKQFLTDTGIIVKRKKKVIRKVSVIVNHNFYIMEASFHGFIEALGSYFPQANTEIKSFVETVEKIGIEWKSFIKSKFDPGAVRFTESSKYMGMSLEKACEKYGFPGELKELLLSIVPVRDISFSVYSGYLYTQFFDINALDGDIWKDISQLAGSRQKKIVVSNLKHMKLQKGKKVEEVEEKICCVLDFRPRLKEIPEENESKKVIRGMFFNSKAVLEDDTLYIAQIDDGCNVKIWNSTALHLEDRNAGWQFEITDMCGIAHTEIISKLEKWVCVQINSDIRVCSDTVTEEHYFDGMYDVNNDSGYCWAFNKSQSLLDPTNLFRKQTDTYFNCSHWGFAWFSAAYNAYNAILRQMYFKDEYYKINGNED